MSHRTAWANIAACRSRDRHDLLRGTRVEISVLHHDEQPRHRRLGRGGSLAIALTLALLAMLPVAGCDKINADRKQAEERRRAQEAINAYSKASDKVNGLHSGIISAFGRANQAANLPDYREALRNGVIPAMERFVARLEKMPTGTPELQRIHLGLVAAYRRAIEEIGSFVRDLRSPQDLPAFNPIRDRLQQQVGLYNRDLDAYYRRFKRELRFEGAQAPPAAATATSAPDKP